MNDAIVPNGTATSLDSPIGREFVADAVRAGEGVLTDAELCVKYELAPETLTTLTQSRALIRAIQAESVRRINSGQAARESAARHFAQSGPKTLNELMADKSTHPKFRIESARALRETAHGGDASDKQTPANAAEKFVITINLGADHIEHFEKVLEPVKALPATNKGGGDWGWEERE